MSINYTMARFVKLLCISAAFFQTYEGVRRDDVIQLYYGSDESERGLPRCESPAQACSVLLERYWRAGALVRLCRCQRRHVCPLTVTRDDSTVALNNRAHFKFCEPINHLPACKSTYIGMSVSMNQPNYNPDEFEGLHHRNIIISPPKITAYCQCTEPYYWKFHSSNTTNDEYPTMHLYKCVPLGACKSGEYCGNVRYDIDSLYQSCSCPLNHGCIHRGGLHYDNITEILYTGRGRRAYCERLHKKENTSEEYYDEE